jgi:hypothetical protein
MPKKLLLILAIATLAIAPIDRANASDNGGTILDPNIPQLVTGAPTTPIPTTPVPHSTSTYC